MTPDCSVVVLAVVEPFYLPRRGSRAFTFLMLCMVGPAGCKTRTGIAKNLKYLLSTQNRFYMAYKQQILKVANVSVHIFLISRQQNIVINSK